MSTCAKRAVIQVGDRPARVRKAALAVQSAVQQMQPRVLPSTGGQGRPLGMPGGFGRPLNHGALGGGGLDPIGQLARAIGQLGREVADTVGRPQGPVGHSGGRNAASGGTSSVGNGTFAAARIEVGVFTAAYTEPLEIPIPPRFRPVTIMAGRIDDPNDPERYFRSGVACDWKYTSSPNTVSLRSIDGMTIGDPTIIQYTFIYIGYSTNG